MQNKKEILSIIENIIKKNGGIDLPAQGVSMFPFIKEGEICRFIPVEPSQLKKGEIVLFHSLQGQLIAHRLHKSFVKNGETYFLFKGDSNLGFDELVRENQIIGKLSKVKGRSLLVEYLYVSIYRRLILSFPLLSRLFRMYVNKFKI